MARLDRPAWWSVSALNDCLRKRIAVGLLVATSSAHAFASAMTSPGGTTLLTRFIARASWAEYIRHQNQISRAFFSPTTRARYAVPNPASKDPTRGPAWPKRAVSLAIDTSHRTCRTCPPPTATPLTAAMTGLGMSRITLCSAPISNIPDSLGP